MDFLASEFEPSKTIDVRGEVCLSPCPDFSPASGCNSQYGSVCCVTLRRLPRRIAGNTPPGASVASLAATTISSVSLRKPVRRPGKAHAKKALKTLKIVEILRVVGDHGPALRSIPRNFGDEGIASLTARFAEVTT